MSFAVVTRELSKSYANCQALDKVSLEIREGEMVALLGASGSGKSTWQPVEQQIDGTRK